jgi:hypothetical protein
LHCYRDPFLGSPHRCVESGDVVNDLAGIPDPIPGRFVDGADTVEKPGSVTNTDLSPDSASLEFDEEGVKAWQCLLRSRPMSTTINQAPMGGRSDPHGAGRDAAMP